MKQTIIDRLEKAIKDNVFPGCVVGVVYADGKREVYPVGNFTYESDSPAVKEDTIYDVASVTKSIPGSSSLLKLIDEGKIKLEDKVVDYIPEFGNKENKKDVRIRHILTYTLDLGLPSLSALKDTTADQLLDTIIKAPLKSAPGSNFLYVNSTAAFIGLIVQKVIGKGLDEYANEVFFKPFKMDRTTFHPEHYADIFIKEEIAPTEIDEWRGRVIQGEVHDESTFILQQKYISGIAGLFTTVPDLLNFEEMLLHKGVMNGKRYFSEGIVQEMHTNQIGSLNKSAGLGWEMNSSVYTGSLCSPQTFDKTGFTGCLVAIDPVKGRALAFLANRTYPKRPKNSEAINAVRRDIANSIFD